MVILLAAVTVVAYPSWMAAPEEGPVSEVILPST